MNFCGIQRDVDEVLISGLFSLGFFPSCPRGWAPGRSGRVLVNEKIAAAQRIAQKTLVSVS